MSVSPVPLGSSLAPVGIQVAGPGRLDPVRDTVKGALKTDSSSAAQDEGQKTGETGYTPSEQRQIVTLQRIDTEVRAHEQAHINVGRELITGGPNYEYTYGPDGKQYAVAGEVGIDTSPEHEPQANIDKGLRIQDAALAPADPSPQDYSVAATGKQLEERGRSDLREQQLETAASGDSRLQAYAAAPDTDKQVDVYA